MLEPMTRQTYGMQDHDCWLLPDDGIIDRIAVGIAVNGTRKVCLTWSERFLATERIKANGGTCEDVSERLSLPRCRHRTEHTWSYSLCWSCYLLGHIHERPRA
jgi:hypothetical protein